MYRCPWLRASEDPASKATGSYRMRRKSRVSGSDRTPYDEAKYLQALVARKPKQSGDFPSNLDRGKQPEFIWTSRNGFNK
jgi:hypothetical protein